MPKKKSNLFLYVFLIIVLSACNLPSGETATEEVSDLALTVTAQALLLQNSPTPEFTATPQFTSTPENTATPSVPQVSVSVNTNCRTGPGVAYDLLGGLNIGQTAEVVGKSSSTGYWIIKLPGSNTICWLFPQHATVSGNTANLPEYPVPPTPTPSLPAAPKNFKANVTCVLQNNPIFINQVEVKLTWEDVANNESGYRIYQNGTEIIALAADSTSYTHDTTLAAIWLINTPKPSHTYKIEAYNSAGKSDAKEVKVECP
jgi:hypothetical protein